MRLFQNSGGIRGYRPRLRSLTHGAVRFAAQAVPFVRYIMCEE